MRVKAELIGMVGNRIAFYVDEGDADDLGVHLMYHKKGQKVSLDIKKWKPLKTNKQLGLFFSAVEWFCIEAYDQVDEHMKELVYQGIVEKYGDREDTGLVEEDGKGRLKKILVPIRLSECNRYEQFEKVFEGLFREAEEQKPPVDMSGWIKRWQDYKQYEIEERRKAELKAKELGGVKG